MRKIKRYSAHSIRRYASYRLIKLGNIFGTQPLLIVLLCAAYGIKQIDVEELSLSMHSSSSFSARLSLLIKCANDLAGDNGFLAQKQHKMTTIAEQCGFECLPTEVSTHQPYTY